jgi:hypothetical protein
MKANKNLIAIATAAILMLGAFRFVIAKNGGGTSILHFMARASMTATESDSDATCEVRIKRNQQGNADNQRLEISAAKLEASSSYQIWAYVAGAIEPQYVADVATDSNGVVSVKYSAKGQGKGKGPGQSLPAGLNPVSDILALQIANASTQAVLTVDVTNPSFLQYLIKRSLSNDAVELGAEGWMRIKATHDFVQLRVRAKGLTPSATYFLAVNDIIADSYVSDANGQLDINGFPAGVPAVLDIAGVAILNYSSNSVLSAQLPE